MFFVLFLVRMKIGIGKHKLFGFLFYDDVRQIQYLSYVVHPHLSRIQNIYFIYVIICINAECSFGESGRVCVRSEQQQQQRKWDAILVQYQSNIIWIVVYIKCIWKIIRVRIRSFSRTKITKQKSENNEPSNIPKQKFQTKSNNTLRRLLYKRV